MLQEINRVRQRLGLAPLGIVAAGGNTRAARSARARKQLRDRYGKWIEMGGGIRWNAPSGIKYSGTVNGFQGNYVTVTDVKYVRPDGATGELPSATVHHDNVEVQVEQRADLGDIKNAVESAPAPTAASTPEQDDAIVKAFRALGADDDTIAAILAAPDRDTAEQVWSDTEVGQSVEDKITSAMMADSPQPQEKKLVSNYNYAWKLVDDKFAADEPDTEPEQPDADTRPDGVDENAPSDALFSVDTELEDWVDAREMQPGDEVMPRATGGLANDAVGVKHLNPGGRYHLTGEIWTVQDVNSEDGSQLAEITVQKEDDSTTKFIVQGPFKMLRANDNIRAQLGVDAPDPDEPNDDPAADLPDDTDSEPSDGEVYDALFEAYNSLRDAGITEDDFDYGDIMVQLDDTAQRLYGEESVDPAAIEALVDDARAMANEIDNDAVKASLNKAANQLEQLLDTPVLYGQDDESVTEFDFDYTQITAESVPDATPSGATPTLSAAEVAAQRTALAHYVGNGYRDINTGLRNNGGLTESQENVVTHLDNLIARSRLPESMELYRGVDNDSGWLPDQLEPGTIISDDAFMSVTDDESVSSEFANFGDTGVMFVIDAAAGHPAVNVKSMLPDNVTAESESEWLLPRGTQLSVVSDYVVEDGDFKRRYIEVDLVPVVQNNATNDTIEPTEENDNGTAEEAGSQPEAGGAPDVVESGPGEDNTPTEAEAEEDTTQEVAGVVQSITELDNLPAGSILEFTRPDGVVWLYEKKDSRPDSWRGPDGPMSRSFLEKAIGNGRVSVAQIPTAYADEYTPPPSQDPLLVSRDALPDGFWGFEIEPGTTPEGPSNGLTDNVWRMTPQLEGRLTKAAADGMANYLLDRRKTLNHMVRHGWTPENNYGVRHAYVSTSGWGDEDTVDAEKFYYNMLEATSLAKLPPGLRLYRGALFDKNDFPAHLEPGEYVVDTGFASTSRDRDYAVDFAGDLTQDGVHVLWEIEVGEGVTGMDMDLAHGNPEHSWNREYVLPPNTALEVIEDRGADETGLRTIRARVIPAHAMPDNAVQAYPVSDPLEPPPYDNPDISDVTNMPTVKVNKDVLAEFNEREVLLRRAVDSQPTPLSAPEEHVSALWGTAGTIYGPYLVVDGSLYNRNGRLVSPLLNQFDGIIAVEDAQFDGPAPSSIFSGEPVTELASPSDLFRLPTESVVSFTRQDGTTETYTKVGPVAWRRDGENYNSSQAALNELLKYDSVASTLVYNPRSDDTEVTQNESSISTTSLTENPPAESVVTQSSNNVDVKSWWLQQSSEALSDEDWLYKPFDPYSITNIDPAIEEAVRNLESTSYVSGGQQIPWKNDVQRSLEFAIAVQSAYDGDLVVDANDSEKEWPESWTAATADAVIDELVELSNNQDEINSRTTAAALLYKAVAAASPTTEPLYRGTNTYPGSAMYNAIVDGGVFSTHLTSWTGEKTTAESYVREFPWPGEPIPVVLEAEPGAKMLDLGWVGSNTPIGFQDHWLGAGRFKVESVEIENGAYHVKVRQLKPDENPDPSGGYGAPLSRPDSTDKSNKSESANAVVSNIAELDEQPVGTLIQGRTDADVALDIVSSTTYRRAPDGTWDKDVLYGEEPKKLEYEEALQLFKNGPVKILPWGASSDEATGPSFPDETATTTQSDEPIDVTGWQKVGGQQGSNPGGTYIDPDGNQYYVKRSKTDDHAKNEVLARKLYDLAGVDSAQLELADVGDGRLGTVSPLVPGAKQDLSQKRFDPEYRAKLQEGFAVDAWLANWDVAGLAFDNIVTDEDGNPVRIDPGGALLFRAMGSPKGDAFGDSVTEWNTLRSGTNAQSAAIFGDIPTHRLKSSAQRVADISPEEIDATVDSVGFDADTAERLKETLKARRLDLMQRAGISDSASVITEVDQDLSQDELLALRNYGKIWYNSINGRLRNGTVNESPEVAEKIKQLDSALSKSRLTADTQVYRGVYGDFVDQLVEGATVQDLGYMSTARTPDPAEFFATKYDSDKEAVIRINVPAGTNAVDFGMVGLTEFSQEKEVLLPRGTTLLITGVETGTDKHPDLKIITADVVPADLSVSVPPQLPQLPQLLNKLLPNSVRNELGVEALQGVEQALLDMYERAPHIFDVINGVELVDTEHGKWIAKVTDRILINRKYAKTSLANLYKDQLDEGISAPFDSDVNPWRATLTHELGHAIESYLLSSPPVNFEGQQMSALDALWKTIGKEFGVADYKNLSRKQIAKKIPYPSTYALKDDSEFLAEMWMSYTLRDNPNSSTKRFGALIEDAIGANKSGKKQLGETVDPSQLPDATAPGQLIDGSEDWEYAELQQYGEVTFEPLDTVINDGPEFPDDAPSDSAVSEADAQTPDEIADTAFGTFEVLDDPGQSGDGYYPGTHKWGKYGAAGVLLRHVDPDDGIERFLLVQRGPGVSTNVGRWQLPGGALNSNENDYQGTARELNEELDAPTGYIESATPVGEVRFDDPTGWHYTNIAADVAERFDPTPDGTETGDAGWFTRDEIAELDLHPSLADSIGDILDKFAGDDSEPPVDELPATSDLDDVAVETDVDAPPAPPAASSELADLPKLPYGTVGDSTNGPYVTLSDGTNVSVGSAVAHPTKGYTGVIEKVEKNGKYVQVAVNEHGGVWHGLTTSKLVSGDVQQTTVPPAPSPEPEPVLMPDNGEWDIPDDVRSGISDVVAALEYVDLSESSSLQALARVADEDDDYSVDNRDHLLSILYDADADLGYMSQTGPSQSTKTAATTARELLQDLITGLEGERVSEPNQIVDAEVGLEPSADFSVGKQITVDDDTTNIPVGTVLRLQSGVFAGGQEFILKIDDGSWITRDGLDLTDTEVENYIGSDNVSVFVDRVGDNEPLEWDSDFENYFVGDQSFANYEGSPQDASSDVDVQPESPSDVPAAEIDGNAWLQSQPKMPYGQVGYTDGGAVYATLGDGTNVLIGSTVSHPAKGYTGTVVDIEANGKYVQVLVNETGKKHGLTTSKLVGVQQRSAPDAPTAADEQTSPTTPAASPQLDEITLDMLAGMLPAHKAKLTTSLYNAIQLSNDDTATNRAKADAFKTVHSKLQQVKSDNGAADDAQLDALDTFEFAIESVIKSYDPSWNASVEPVESVESIEQLTPGDQIPSVSVLNGLPAGSIVHFKPYSNSATYVYIKRGNGKWYMQVGEQLHDVVDPAALEASVDAGSITFASAPSVQSDEDASTTSPDVPGLTWGSLVSGDKIPGVAVLEELPVGSVVEYAVDDDTPDTYIKNADGQWELHPYSLTKIDSDAWTQAINAGHAFFVSVPSNLPTVSTPFYVSTPAQLDELPAGSKLTYTVPSSGNTYNYTKSAGGKWTLDDGSMAPFPSEAFGYLINDAPNSVVVTSVPALTPQDLAGTAPLPAPGEILTNKQQLIDLPPGSTMTYTSPIYGVGTDYIKLDNGNWASMEQGAEASNAAFFVPLTEGQVSLKSLPQPQPSPSTQAPDATSLPPAPSGPHRNDAFGNPVFVGTKVQSTNTGETGYVVQMHSNPNYVKVAFTDSNGKTKTKVRALSKLEALDKYAPVQSDGLTADFSLVPGSYMNDNDMLDALHIGSKIAVRQHNSVEQLWTKTDTNTYVNDVSGSAVDKHYFSNFAATGQLKYVSAPPGPKTPASLSSPTVQPSHTIDPSSPWFGKPKPVAPPPLSESTTPWVVDSEAFENEVRTNYPLVFDGKLYDASTITKERVDTVVESGDKDNLKSLYNRKLISDDTYNALLSHINIVEGYKAQELADYAASMAKYESDLSAWMKAHGLSDGEFDVGSFISKGMNEGVVTHTSNSQAEEWWSSRMPGATHFSASAKSGLKSYVSSSYSLNIALRQDRMATLQPGYTPHTGGVMFTKMEKAMKEATPVPEDVIVFRGGDLKEWMLPDGTNASTKESFLAKVKPGAIVRDFGYVSASVGTSAAFSHKSLQIRIRVSKGTKAIFVGGNGLGGFSGERELILYRNTHYLVHSVYVDGNQIRVDVETVPPGWTPEQGALNEQAVVNAAQAAIDAVSNADAPEEIPDTLAPPTFTKKSTFALDYHRAAEKMVIKQYTEESGTRYYNDRLRSGEVVLPAPRLSAIGAEHYQRLGGDTNGENYDALDSAIARQRTKNPATVYRGIAMPDTFDPAVGDVISDLGYSSTSNSKEMASAFAEMRATGKSSNLNMIGVAEPSGGKPVVMEIYLPEGTPGVVGDTSVGEVILPRQSKFRVHGKRDDGTLVVEWIGAGEL